MLADAKGHLEQYLESVASPDHEDIGNRGWIRMAECKRCAIKCDRWPDTRPETEQ